MFLWRISNYATLDGIGGTLQSARWHSQGRPIIYAADHPAAALLEMLANFDTSLLPDTFQLLKIAVPSRTQKPHAMPHAGWLNDVSISRSLGDNWLARRKSLLLKVPSAILPHVFNVLINPQHPQAAHLKIVGGYAVPLDARLK